MKGAILATAAAALVGTAVADVAHMKRGHDAFHHRRAVQPSSAPEADESCGCTTKVITVWGPPTMVPAPAPETSTAVTTLHSTSTSTRTVHVTPSSSAAPVSTSSAAPVLPTNPVTSFSSTGVYTIPATTITVTDSTTVCNAASTEVPSGTHTVGGVTTVVETATTVTCPYATVKPTGSTVTSVIETTTYVCPSAGTYTIAPITTTVPSNTVIVYPTPASFTPGTYTQSEQTITATRTDITYVCPLSSSAAPTTTPAPAPAPTTAAPSSSSSTAAPSSSSSTASATSAPLIDLGLGATNHRMGMTYSPYTNSGQCQGQDEISKNIASIKKNGFTHVRVYSTDCNGLEYIGNAARQNGLKMIIGAFVSSAGVSSAQEQIDAISKWAQWDLVTLIVVGNEAVNSGYINAGQLAGLISSAKQTFKSSGYTGDVTTTEPINVWQSSGSALCDAVDIVGANLHPFFNPDTTADQAGSFVKSQFDALEKICPKKDIINLETGWPSKGDPNGKAVPGIIEQQTAISSLAKAVGDKSVFFSFADDLWKSAGSFNIEQSWGCMNVFTELLDAVL